MWCSTSFPWLPLEVRLINLSSNLFKMSHVDIVFPLFCVYRHCFIISLHNDVKIIEYVSHAFLFVFFS